VELAEDDAAVDVHGVAVAASLKDGGRPVAVGGADEDVRVAARTVRGIAVDRVPDVRPLDRRRADSGGTQRVEHATRLTRPRDGRHELLAPDGAQPLADVAGPVLERTRVEQRRHPVAHRRVEHVRGVRAADALSPHRRDDARLDRRHDGLGRHTNHT
jgi:hypothetical protein